MSTHVGASSVRSVAFYLPQYHPIAENDRTWGAGFTEWHNVVRAKPRFPGHRQPHLPGELGFYDLRLDETRRAQEVMASEYDVGAFCYYHYWFSGRRLLAEPLDRMRSGDGTFPFCLAWANEPWTRAWDGRTGEVIVPQQYGFDDDLLHARFLAGVFADPRYARVDGRPLFLVYRASLLPEPKRSTDTLRGVAAAEGVGEPFLVRIESFPDEARQSPTDAGFDAAVEFQPDWRTVRSRRSIKARHLARHPGELVAWVRHGDRTHPYADLARVAMEKVEEPAYVRFPGVTPGWDNSSRRRRGAYIFTGATPSLFEEWVAAAHRRARTIKKGDSLVFVNAWNEWGEGCHLEPGWGEPRSYLEAHARGVARARADRL